MEMMWRTVTVLCLITLPMVMAKGYHTEGWVRVTDLNNPTVVEMAQYAVAVHNMNTMANLRLNQIVGAEWELESDLDNNYKIVLLASDNRYYKAKVEVKSFPPGLKKLSSFEPLV